MYQINFEDEKRTVNQSRILDKNVVAEIIFGLDLMNNIVEHHPSPKINVVLCLRCTSITILHRKAEKATLTSGERFFNE